MANYLWTPLADLTGRDLALSTGQLETLAAVWMEQREQLEQQDSVQDFLSRLKRRWAIETGVIENLYTLDRGITEVLIQRGIVPALIPSSATNHDPDYVAALIEDQLQAVDGLFSFVKSERPLSTSYVKEIHAHLTAHQPTTTGRDTQGRPMTVKLLRGEYKSWPNNPTRQDGSVHEYCPPEQVASEMDNLISLHLKHVRQGIPPEIEAAWLHHRFTQIHPFMDGNGRVARCLASLVFIKSGRFPLVVTRDDREPYIDALEAADWGDLGPLISLMEKLQRQAFVGALSSARAALDRPMVSSVISAARDLILSRREELSEEWALVETLSDALQHAALTRLEKAREDLITEIASVLPGSHFDVQSEVRDGERSHYCRYQVIETAKDLGYFANLNSLHSWLRLKLVTAGLAEILLSFHGVGRDFRGVVAVSACFWRREETEDGREVTGLQTLAGEPFLLNYRDHVEDLEPRFLEWLERALVAGLETWRRGL